LKDQQLKLENTMDLDVLLKRNQSQEIIGQKCIDYLGNPRKQGNSQQKGLLGEVIAAYKLARLGYDVRWERPCNYDLTIHGDKGITRIQVKTFINVSDGKGYDYKKINLSKCDSLNQSGKQAYLLTDFDFVAAVDVETEEVFLVPIRDLESPNNLGRTKRAVTKKSINSYKI
jgi:hypothetical protein